MNKKAKKRSRLSIFVPKSNINMSQGFDADFWFSEGYKLFVEGKLVAAIDWYKQGLKFKHGHEEVLAKGTQQQL